MSFYYLINQIFIEFLNNSFLKNKNELTGACPSQKFLANANVVV